MKIRFSKETLKRGYVVAKLLDCGVGADLVLKLQVSRYVLYAVYTDDIWNKLSSAEKLIGKQIKVPIDKLRVA